MFNPFSASLFFQGFEIFDVCQIQALIKLEIFEKFCQRCKKVLFFFVSVWIKMKIPS